MTVIREVATRPYNDQQPGTSGLRKKTQVFIDSANYLENYIQSCFSALLDDLGVATSKSIVIGGDGRYLNDKLMQTTVKIAVANGFSQILLAKDGILSTPAASHIIRQSGASCGFVFSASHNPGGKDGDIGIKLNMENGGPAPVNVTDAIYAKSKAIQSFKIAETADIDLTQLASYQVGDSQIKVIDGVQPYVELMQTLFDFSKIKAYLQSHQLFYDAMHAVTGPYAKAIFVDTLGVNEDNVINTEPLPDFGGLHPDPNPVTAKILSGHAYHDDCPYSLLAASDGDGDRNLIMGKGIFVNPCDSLAVITANASSIPLFKNGISGVIRSMPTSRAVDAVAQANNIDCYETPTGWKFFGNLLDCGKANLCGEESFGTSANHIREKDGIWAVLCWLNILADKSCEVAELMENHWQKYSRHYYGRFDFENLDKAQADQLLTNLNTKSTDNLIFADSKVTASGQFNYTDITDNSSVSNQGYQAIFADKARFVVRLSGTGTSGATLRLYLEVRDADFNQDNQVVISQLANLAIDFIEIKRFCARVEADMIVA